MSVETEKLIAAYVNCRDSLDKERKAYKAVEKEHKEDMAAIAEKLMEAANAQGVESFKTKSGTAFKKQGYRISVKDWDEALKYIVKYDLTHMLTKSVTKAAAKEFMDANKNQLPPGLKYEGFVEIQVRRK